MDFMFDWEAEGDRFSFEDSDRFEEDSLCSWISEPESLCNNWRGWRRQNGGIPMQLQPICQIRDDNPVSSLVELASQAVACHIPFEVVEHFYPPIPENLQLRIAFWSFPENEEDIRLYSCLATGSADDFQKGEHLYKAKGVKDALQIGFHLSATVIPPQTLAQTKGSFNVAVVFDRRRITACNCTCSPTASWCAHVVALCLYRIHQATSVVLRAPVSESLGRLHREQLQKFAQYLISELPQQILPTAQRLLDELLSCQKTAINTVRGAPDPTAGASASEQTSWCLDETRLHENIKKTLIKFCVPSPIVFSDVNYLSSTAPPAAMEWQSLLRPLRGREPEGMWNLLSIVQEMFKRNDSNAVPLLHILTEEVLSCEQILIWWFNTKISAVHNNGNTHGARSGQNSSSSSQHAASSLCDEIVMLWRLSSLNPALSPLQRSDLLTQFKYWHILTVDKVRKARGSNVAGGNNAVKKTDVELFAGFKPAMEGCYMDWCDYVIPGITYDEHNITWNWRFSLGMGCGRHAEGGGEGLLGLVSSRPKNLGISQVSCSMKAVTENFVSQGPHNSVAGGVAVQNGNNNVWSQVIKQMYTSHADRAYSSSSEGFCDSDRRDSGHRPHDSDSDVGESEGQQSRKGSQQQQQQPLVVVATKEGKTSAASKGSQLHSTATHQALSTSQTAATLKHQGKGEELDSEVSSPTKLSKSQQQQQQQQQQAASTQQGSQEAAAQAATMARADGSTGKPATARAEVSESQQSSDDQYQVYYYDTRAKVNDQPADKKKKPDEPNYFAGIKKIDNKQDILFARAEALHAHGHTREACRLARQLAEEMLASPPDLTSEQPQPSGKGKKKKGQNNASCQASSLLSRAAFFSSVLLDEPECHHLAFKVGLFGLEMARPPAANKALEVKLAYQESEMVTMLKKIPLGLSELNIIRERAEKLRDGKLKSRGDALLPLTLASFIFDSLCLPVCPVNGNNSRPPSRSVGIKTNQPADEKLGFEAAVAALGLKANVSEADHPLLCEGTRRQRGDLAVAMLVHYKDDQVKLSKILDKLLDKEVHQLYKAPSLSTYLASTTNTASLAARAGTRASHQAAPAVVGAPVSQGAPVAMEVGGPTPLGHRKTPSSGCESDDSMSLKEDTPHSSNGTLVAPSSANSSQISATPNSPASLNSSIGATMWQPDAASPAEMSSMASAMARNSQSLDYLNLEQKFSSVGLGATNGARPKTSQMTRHNSKDTDSSALEEEGEASADYKAWEAKFRCTNLKTFKKHSVGRCNGMASIDSSAPETTSSDNSPTLVRRNWGGKHHGPGSDSGSSGKSSDSFGSSSSGDKVAAAKLRDNESPPVPYEVRYAAQLAIYSRSSTPNIKGGRYKGKNRIMPTVPNQPSEASAHFMFELAKTVLNKAGGNSSTSLFTQPANNNNPTGPHRALHLCAFQTGLYALGLHNCVSPNWLSRTYSSHVSWITGQAMEIGSAAINILIDTWEGHLTPQEVASLADRASRGRDPNMVRAAAELALSCLPHAQALNPNEIQRALIQCKEQSRDMLERACLAVESAAKGGGVYPEVLFDVAKRWYELYEESVQGPNTQGQPGAVVVGPANMEDTVQAAVVIQNVDQVVVAAECSSPSVLQLVPVHSVASAAMPMQVALTGQGQLPPGAVAMPPLPYNIPPPVHSHSPQLPHHPYIAPYSYVQQVPPNFAHHYSAPHIPLHTHNMHPSYMATYPYQSQSGAAAAVAAAAFGNIPHLQHNTTTLYHAQVSHLPPPPPTAVRVAYSNSGQLHPLRGHANVVQGALQPMDPSMNGNQAVTAAGTVVIVSQQQPSGGPNQQVIQAQQPASQQQQQQQQQPQQHPQQQQQQQQLPELNLPAHGTPQMNYLLATYRVGMLAMETLARRVHDDRPQTKYARNPPYGEDVKWLLGVAMKLGVNYLKEFCGSAVNAIVSPFVLQDIAVEAAHFLSRNNPSQVSQQLRSPTLNSLVQKCLQAFIQCTHQRMHHINQGDYDEFVAIVCSARNAFCMTPGGMVQFNELLQSLRRSKSCKKELWQRIVNGLATGNI